MALECAVILNMHSSDDMTVTRDAGNAGLVYASMEASFIDHFCTVSVKQVYR